jgi:hypothetical protein
VGKNADGNVVNATEAHMAVDVMARLPFDPSGSENAACRERGDRNHLTVSERRKGK